VSETGNVWPLQEAKNKLNEVIEKALREGPQIVTWRGKEVAVVLSKDEFEQLLAPKEDLASFLARSPLAGLELDLERDASSARDVEL